MIYAHHWLADGVEISSVPRRIEGIRKSVAKTVSSPQVCHFPMAADLWYSGAPVDPFYPCTPLLVTSDGQGLEISILESNSLTYQFNTRWVGKLRDRSMTGGRFCCRLQGPVQDPVTVAVLKFAGSPREHKFLGDFSVAALAQGVNLGELKDSAGRPLRSIAGLSHLYIGGKTTAPGIVSLRAVSWQP